MPDSAAAEDPHPVSTTPAALPAPAWRFHPGDLLAAILVIGWAVFMLMRIRYGLDLTDEGMYLSATDRLLRGDITFRDDQESPVRPYNLLMSWLWYPGGGFSLLAARSVGVALQLTQMVAVWLVVRRGWGAWLAAIAAVMVPRVPLMAIWSPGYNDLACTFSMVFAACLALSGTSAEDRGGRRWAAAWGAVAGVALVLDGLSYMPTLALAVVPVGMVVWGRWRGSWRHPWVVGGAAALATTLVGVLGFVGWVLGSGLGSAWMADTHAVYMQQNLAFPLLERVTACVGLMRGFGIHLVVTVVLLAAVRWTASWLAARSRRVGASVVFGVGLLAALAYDLFGDTRLNAGQYDLVQALYLASAAKWKYQVLLTQMEMGAACVMVFVLPGGIRDAWRGRTGGLSGMTLAVAVIVLFGAINAVSSTIAGYSGLSIRAAVEAIGAAGAGAFLLRLNPAAPMQSSAGRAAWVPAAPAVLCQVILAALAGAAGWTLVYRDAVPADCTATFVHAPLAGVKSTPQRVAAIGALQEWVDAHEAPDARLLSYHDAPGLYFITRRRPVLAYTWTTPLWPWNNVAAADAWCGGLIAQMEQAGIHPDFCVRNLANPYQAPFPCGLRLNDPIHAYANAHFHPVWRCWPYEVLVPNDARTPPAQPVTLVDALAPGADSATAEAPAGAGDFEVYCGPTDHDPTGALDVNVDPAVASDLLASLTERGSEPIALRLRIASDSPDFYVAIVMDHAFAPMPGMGDRACTGWDVTFPGGKDVMRGFAILRRGPVRPRYTFRQLSLEKLPPVPGPP
jgi:hypothetical protein